MRLVLHIAMLLVLAGISGCGVTVKQSFDGRDPEQVWSAMRAVAENPDYNDWHVVRNEVHEMADEYRLEVHRQLRRLHVEPGLSERMEDREWRFAITVNPLSPPVGRFTARGWHIPAWVWEEAERYFAQVEQLLGESPPEPAQPVEPDDETEAASVVN